MEGRRTGRRRSHFGSSHFGSCGAISCSRRPLLSRGPSGVSDDFAISTASHGTQQKMGVGEQSPRGSLEDNFERATSTFSAVGATQFVRRCECREDPFPETSGEEVNSSPAIWCEAPERESGRFRGRSPRSGGSFGGCSGSVGVQTAPRLNL